MTKQLSKTAQVVKFFAQQCEDSTNLRLQKLAYMADLESRKLLGRPITDFEYTFHTFGPFDKTRLYAAINELEAAELVNAEKRDVGEYPLSFVKDKGVPVAFEFSAAESEILHYVAREFSEMDIKPFLEEIVYETEPMKAAARGEPVSMDSVNNIDRNRIGFDLETVMAAQLQARQGKTKPAHVFFNEFKARHHAVGAGAD